MSVQARFYVAETTRYAYNPGQLQVTLRAVSRGPENKTWAAATPAGEVKLTVSNEAAATWFAERLGKDVACTFEDRPMRCTKCNEDVTLSGQYVQDPQVDGQLVCTTCYQKQMA